MRDCDYYPEGAYSDPNAPYNQTDSEDIYGDDAREQIDGEIKTFDPLFCEFVSDRIDEKEAERMGMPDDIYSKAWEEWYCYQDCGWRDRQEDAYYDYRFDDVIEYMAENCCDDGPDYDERDEW